MSFENDITNIKKILEDKPIFKPASPENLAKRDELSQENDIAFSDHIMQDQYEDLRRTHSPEEARRMVMQAHSDYYGDSASFYGTVTNER